MRTFYERNGQWQNSPRLRFEEQQLNRQVAVQQELYLSLRREYETARIEEVNDTPLFTVIDPAVPRRERSGPRRVVWVFVAFLVGVVLLGSIALSTGWGSSDSSSTPAAHTDSTVSVQAYDCLVNRLC